MTTNVRKRDSVGLRRHVCRAEWRPSLSEDTFGRARRRCVRGVGLTTSQPWGAMTGMIT